MAGVESAVHAIRYHFDSPESDAILLVDANNAFNSLNRNAALHNIRFECPSFSAILINTYREASDLLIDGDVTYSMEGTTQGDPLAMAMYAISTLLLIRRFHSLVTQVWYADDAAASSSLNNICDWWDDLQKTSPSNCYFPNPKSLGSVITKALAMFSGIH